MKRKSNLYQTIIDLKKIEKMYDKRIKKNTRNKKKLEQFELYYVSNMVKIKKKIESKNYISKPYHIFFIKEPKLRLIMSQEIEDKVINHLVSDYFLVKIFEPTLINENIATRKNKGTSYGIKLLKQYLNQLKDKEFYILKFDIKKYFYHLDHDILKQLVRRKIKDYEVLEIIDTIIDSTDEPYVNETINQLKQHELKRIKQQNNKRIDKRIEEIINIPLYQKGKGLPIGNMTSQILAILYLNELDYYIKEQLKIKYYIRYMDDGILLHESKDYLKYCLKEIETIIKKYQLELNHKTKIISKKEGVEFLGFRYYIKNDKVIMKVKNQTKRRFKRKMKVLHQLVKQRKIDIKQLEQVKASYYGHLSYGSTRKLIKTTLKPYQAYCDIGKEVRIINNEIIHK